MDTEWMISALTIAIAAPIFGKFESIRPTWTRVARWLGYLAVTALLGATLGRPATLLWVIGLPATAVTLHAVWCRRHHIHPVTAQPWDRYVALRNRQR
jgi:hypothetical protein